MTAQRSASTARSKRVSPRVTVALYVYNGENYVASAIESLLAQTYRDFELLIVDNASTDGTAAICERFAANDDRIRIVRNERNIGPNLNAQRGLDLAHGEYFKWAAHDDLHAPTFLEKCVAVLDADPDVVVCQSLVHIIDGDDQPIAVYDSGLEGADAGTPSQRFLPLVLKRHICTEIFGLFRRNVLLKTPGLTGNYHGCDRAMLAEVALIGKFVQIPEPLFLNREHEGRYVRAVPAGERARFHDARSRTSIELSSWMLYRDYILAIRRHVADAGERWRCYRILARWWLVTWNTPRSATELVSQVVPSFYDVAKSVNDRYLKPQHPTVHRGAERH